VENLSLPWDTSIPVATDGVPAMAGSKIELADHLKEEL
jgi:hypothetical protein